MKNAVSLTICAILLSGCASLVSGHNQNVSVKTSPVSGASCTLTNDKGSWLVPQTPGNTTISRSFGDLTVDCSKKNYNGVSTVASTTQPRILGNALVGGLGGVVVDTYTGAAYDYPAIIEVPLEKS